MKKTKRQLLVNNLPRGKTVYKEKVRDHICNDKLHAKLNTKEAEI